MAYFPLVGKNLVPERKNAPEGKLARKAVAVGDKQYVVLPSRARPIPVSDLTLFGGSVGPRRFYKPEKASVPEFTTRMEDQWNSVGDNVVLKVGYRGQPEPTVLWFKGQELIAPTRRTMITADGAYTELAIFDVQRTDGGFYNCRIESELGVQETGCHVFIQEDGSSGTGSGRVGGSLRAYRSVLYTPAQRYSRF